MANIKVTTVSRSKIKRFLFLMFAMYLVFLFYVTLFTHNYYEYGRSFNLVLFDSIHLMLNSGNSWLMIKNILGNILLFFPLGFLFPCFVPTFRSFFKMVGTGMLISASIEFLQYMYANRIFDIDDILLNSLGTMVGYFVFLFFYGIVRLWNWFRR